MHRKGISRLNEPKGTARRSPVCDGSVHIIGILGAGMSALARLYLERGQRVSGSDIEENERLAALRALGAEIFVGHSISNVEGADRVVFSPAVPRENAELVAARALGVPVVSRARALSDLLEVRKVISIAGSHGKTTTTALLAYILDRAGLRPGYMLGADCASFGGGNARWSNTGPFVSESCEAFRALDFWRPDHCVVTNVDDEHSEHYGSFADLITAFGDFVARVPEGNRVLLCGDCPTLISMAACANGRAETYGFNHGVTWRAAILKETPTSSDFDVWHRGIHIGCASVNLPGRHNALNAVAALAMACNFGVSFEQAASSLAQFLPISRRWQAIGEAAGVRVFDDLAHHPTEIEATLKTARQSVGNGKSVLAVFQPQLHSRVSRLGADFGKALSAANKVVLLPIDSAGETEGGRGSERSLRAALQDLAVPFWSAHSVKQAANIAASFAQSGDIVVTMGPRLAQHAGPEILAALGRPAQQLQTDRAKRKATQSVRRGAMRSLQAGFEVQVARKPDAPCVIQGDREWTYSQIGRYADAAAWVFEKRGLGRGDLVVLTADKSPLLIALVIGALKAGCAFVPIDPKMKRASLFQILHQVGAALIIHDRKAPTDTPPDTTPSCYLEDFWTEVLAADCGPFVPVRSAQDQDLAYAIFTSGSTGTPRLVGVEHRNACNVISHSTGTLFDPQDLALTPFIDSISFDACVHQIFATLSMGGSLLIEPDLPSLMRSKHFNRITNLGGTPSVIARLADVGVLPKTLRVISLGGEVIPKTLISTLRRTTGIGKMFNFYGPTETTIFSSVARLMDSEHGVDQPDGSGNNIGFPIANTRLHLVDDEGRSVPSGEIGEICISGAGVSRGYLGEPGQTAERFVLDQFGAPTGARMYLTGDLGRRLLDGSIEFLGRTDDQIKINGIRIELAEIERHLDDCAGIERAAVIAGGDTPAGQELYAFVTTSMATDLSHVRAELAAQLPPVMVPKAIIRIDALPMTDTGKLKRGDLRSHIPATVMHSTGSVPLDGVEKRVMTLWRSILRRPDLEPHDNFFEFGGDSLASMQMVLSVEKSFGIRLPAQALEDLGTVADMSIHIRRQLVDPKSIRDANPELTERILDKQQAFLAAWKTGNGNEEGLIRHLNPEGGKHGLFWCFQGFPEFRALAGALGPDQPLYGMRSGHMIMEYMPETIAALAQTYCDEMIRKQPIGAFLLGGNCQGATIARAIALTLRARGKEVRRLLLMEQASIWPYDQPTGLIFGRDSSHNPLRNHAEPEPIFRQAYPQGYGLRIIQGGHGTFFSAENVRSLADAINELIPPSQC